MDDIFLKRLELGMKLYNYYQLRIQTGDLIEWQANSLLGWLIRKKTGQNVNHTSGVVLYQMYKGTEVRRVIFEALSDGFKPHYLSDRLKDYDGRVYWYPLKPEFDYNVRIKLAEEAIKLEGRPYGYKDLIDNLFGSIKLDDKQDICSEAWHIALIKSGLLDKNFNDGNSLVPGQFETTGLYLPAIRIY